MIWVQFLLSSIAIVVAANQLAKYGDVIAMRTKLGGLFVGTLLLAGITSLPELLTTINALGQGTPDLAAGNLFGSSMINMLLLAVLDMTRYKERLLRKAAFKHALSGGLAMFLIGTAVFFILADIDWKIGWVGIDSLVLILIYLAGIRLLQSYPRVQARTADLPVQVPDGTPSLTKSLVAFGLASLVLVLVTPWMVTSSIHIAEITGLGTTFIGTTLVALVTSLPELVTTIAATRHGADDMAIGNLFGSNLFNMAALGITDFFYTGGRFLGIVDPNFILVGLLGLIMTGLGLIGNLARLERRIWFIEIDALLLILVYAGGVWFLFSRGVSP